MQHFVVWVIYKPTAECSYPKGRQLKVTLFTIKAALPDFAKTILV
jgi:hypothetical protein